MQLPIWYWIQMRGSWYDSSVFLRSKYGTSCRPLEKNDLKGRVAERISAGKEERDSESESANKACSICFFNFQMTANTTNGPVWRQEPCALPGSPTSCQGLGPSPAAFPGALKGRLVGLYVKQTGTMHLLMWSYGFSFSNCWGYSWFLNIEQVVHSWDKSLIHDV